MEYDVSIKKNEKYFYILLWSRLQNTQSKKKNSRLRKVCIVGYHLSKNGRKNHKVQMKRSLPRR